MPLIPRPPYEVIPIEPIDPTASYETLYLHSAAPGTDGLTVPQGKNLRLLAVVAIDIATPAVAYVPSLIITNEDGTTVIADLPTGNVAANESFRSTWALGLDYASITLPNGNVISKAALPDIPLRPGHKVVVGAYNGIGLDLDVWFYYYQYSTKR